MCRNAVAVLSSFWLFLAPTLCAGGVLSHPCECASELSECEPCCVGEELGCDCVEDGCSHDSCANDPCQAAIALEKQDSVFDFASEEALAAFDTCLEWNCTFLRAWSTGNSGPPGGGKNLSYHLSDIPLLI